MENYLGSVSECVVRDRQLSEGISHVLATDLRSLEETLRREQLRGQEMQYAGQRLQELLEKRDREVSALKSELTSTNSDLNHLQSHFLEATSDDLRTELASSQAEGERIKQLLVNQLNTERAEVRRLEEQLQCHADEQEMQRLEAQAIINKLKSELTDKDQSPQMMLQPDLNPQPAQPKSVPQPRGVDIDIDLGSEDGSREPEGAPGGHGPKCKAAPVMLGHQQPHPQQVSSCELDPFDVEPAGAYAEPVVCMRPPPESEGRAGQRDVWNIPSDDGAASHLGFPPSPTTSENSLQITILSPQERRAQEVVDDDSKERVAAAKQKEDTHEKQQEEEQKEQEQEEKAPRSHEPVLRAAAPVLGQPHQELREVEHLDEAAPATDDEGPLLAVQPPAQIIEALPESKKEASCAVDETTTHSATPKTPTSKSDERFALAAQDSCPATVQLEEHEALKAKAEELRSELASSQAEGDRVKASLEEQLRHEQAEVHHLSATLQSHADEEERRQAEAAELINKLKSELAEKDMVQNDETEALKVLAEGLRTELASIQAEGDQLKASLEEKLNSELAEVHRLSENLQSRTDESERLRAEAHSALSELQSEIGEKDVMRSEIEKLQKELADNADLRAVSADLRTQLASSEAEGARMKSSLEEQLKSELAEVQRLSDKLQCNTSEQEAVREAREGEAARLIESLRSELLEKEAQDAESRNLMDKLKAELAEKEQQKDEGESQILKLKSELLEKESLQSELEQSQHELQGLHNSFEAKSADFQTQLASSQAEGDRVKQQLEEQLKTEAAEVQRLTEALQSRADAQERQQAEARLLVSELKSELLEARQLCQERSPPEAETMQQPTDEKNTQEDSQKNECLVPNVALAAAPPVDRQVCEVTKIEGAHDSGECDVSPMCPPPELQEAADDEEASVAIDDTRVGSSSGRFTRGGGSRKMPGSSKQAKRVGISKSALFSSESEDNAEDVGPPTISQRRSIAEAHAQNLGHRPQLSRAAAAVAVAAEGEQADSLPQAVPETWERRVQSNPWQHQATMPAHLQKQQQQQQHAQTLPITGHTKALSLSHQQPMRRKPSPKELQSEEDFASPTREMDDSNHPFEFRPERRHHGEHDSFGKRQQLMLPQQLQQQQRRFGNLNNSSSIGASETDEDPTLDLRDQPAHQRYHQGDGLVLDLVASVRYESPSSRKQRLNSSHSNNNIINNSSSRGAVNAAPLYSSTSRSPRRAAPVSSPPHSAGSSGPRQQASTSVSPRNAKQALTVSPRKQGNGSPYSKPSLPQQSSPSQQQQYPQQVQQQQQQQQEQRHSSPPCESEEDAQMFDPMQDESMSLPSFGGSQRHGERGALHLRRSLGHSAGRSTASTVDGLSALPPFVLDLLARIEDEGWESIPWKEDYTLLHWAAKHNKPRLCSQLLSLGIDANSIDCKGKTPLAYAFERGSEEAAEILQDTLRRRSQEELQEQSEQQGFDSPLESAVALPSPAPQPRRHERMKTAPSPRAMQEICHFGDKHARTLA